MKRSLSVAVIAASLVLVLQACSGRTSEEKDSSAAVLDSTFEAPRNVDPYKEAASYAHDASNSAKEEEGSSKSVFADPPVWAAGAVFALLILGIILFV